jgi:hypothetical protein
MSDLYNTVLYGSPSADTSAGGSGAVMATVATMVAVGSGDNSANVTTLQGQLAAVGGQNSAIVLTVDLSRFNSRSALVQVIAQLAQQVAGSISGA